MNENHRKKLIFITQEVVKTSSEKDGNQMNDSMVYVVAIHHEIKQRKTEKVLENKKTDEQKVHPLFPNFEQKSFLFVFLYIVID